MSRVINGDARQMNLSEFDVPYGVIVADPPWSYRNKGTAGSAASQYSEMSVDEICSMPVSKLSKKDSVLFLWGTWPLLPECYKVMKAWGFEYKSGFPWIKLSESFTLQGAIGFWVLGVSEYVLIGVRGNAKPPDPSERYLGIIAPNLKHSKKPKSVHDIAETLPGPRLELFAREARIGWTCFGNEVAQANNRLQPTAFGAGTQSADPLQGSLFADESSATNGGG